MKISKHSHLRPVAAVFAVFAMVTLSHCNADNTDSNAPAAENSEAGEQAAAAEPATKSGEKEAAADAGKPIAIAAADFGAFIKGADGVVLVDFWAEWCQPCHIIAPEVEKVASKYSGRVQVVKVDLTEDPGADFSAQYGIDFLPTVIIFKNGKSQGNLVINGRPMPDATGISAALDKQL